MMFTGHMKATIEFADGSNLTFNPVGGVIVNEDGQVFLYYPCGAEIMSFSKYEDDDALRWENVVVE